MNNPTTLIDPSGLQGQNPCANLQYGQGRGQCQNGVNGVIEANTELGPSSWDPFDLMNIPIVLSTWVPPQQVGITGTLPGGNFATAVYYFEGYWTSTQVGTALELQIPGITFTPTGPTTATFVSQSPFWPTVGKFVQKGFTPNPFDLLDRFHPHNLDLRDARLICSQHVDIDWTTGGSGQPTQGSIHVDTVNPNPFWVPPGLNELTYLAHGVFDVFNGGLYPGAQACQ
jgi:hypothetical protein